MAWQHVSLEMTGGSVMVDETYVVEWQWRGRVWGRWRHWLWDKDSNMV